VCILPALKTLKKRFAFWVVLFILVIVTITVSLILTRRIWLPHLYTGLDVAQTPARADVIIVLGGGADRGSYAAAIVTQVQPRRIVLSGGISEIESSRQELLSAGFPASGIDAVYRATSTYDEAERILNHLRQFEYQSVLIVTSPFHTRRALATYTCLSRARDERYDFRTAAYDDHVAADGWWHDATVRNYISSEWIKTVFYAVRYGVVCY